MGNIMTKMSSGSRKELLVLMFVSSIISVSEHEETKTDEDVIKMDNKTHKINKKIRELLLSIKSDINIYVKSIMTQEIAEWIKSKSPSSTMKAVRKAQETKVGLEFLAVWVLYVNFIERKQKLDEGMIMFTKYDYMGLADMMELTAIGETNGDMMMLSYDVVESLKG